MVSTKSKRRSRKDARTRKKVETVNVKEDIRLPTGPAYVEPSVVEPEVKLLTSEETAWKLLDEAPPIPLLRTIEEAVKFVDKYAKWKRNVQGAKR